MPHQLKLGTQAVFVKEQAEKQGCCKIEVQTDEQPARPPVTPDKYAAALQTEGLQDAHHDEGEKTGGKPHVKQVVTHVHGGSMYGERRQNKAGKDADDDGDSQIDGKGKGQQIHKLRHHGSQAGAEKRRINIAVHARIVKLCVEPCAEQHGQDVYRIFAEEGKACVDEEDGHGKAGERNFLPADQKDGQSHHQSCIEEGRAETGQFEVVRDKGIPGEHNGNHTAPKFGWRSQQTGAGPSRR